MGGSRYFLFATDDASRFVRCFPMKRKNEQVTSFLELQAWSKTQTGNVIKMIRSDGEWASNEFKMIKTKSGFEHKMTTPGTPPSNGLAERIGGIIAEKARTMLIDARLPPSFAGEAFRTATYLYNLTPPKLDGKKQALSPSECFYQRNFQVHHLRAFGCKAWIRPPALILAR